MHTQTVVGGKADPAEANTTGIRRNQLGVKRSLKLRDDRHASNRLSDIELEMARYKFTVFPLKLHKPMRVMLAGLIFALILGSPLFLACNKRLDLVLETSQ